MPRLLAVVRRGAKLYIMLYKGPAGQGPAPKPRVVKRSNGDQRRRASGETSGQRPKMAGNKRTPRKDHGRRREKKRRGRADHRQRDRQRDRGGKAAVKEDSHTRRRYAEAAQCGGPQRQGHGDQRRLCVEGTKGK